MPNHAPPAQQRGILRTCYEVFVIASCIFFGLLLGWELSLAFAKALPHRPGLADLYALPLWGIAIAVLVPLGAFLGYRAARWLLRVARGRHP
jgi:purine-cytosine permease-like protein